MAAMCATSSPALRLPVVVLLLSCLVSPGAANSQAFLAPGGLLVSAADLQANLEHAFQDAFSSSRQLQGGRLEQAEQALATMYATLPKNPQGLIAPSTVRYALHRYFVQMHGWFIQGLDPAGGAWNVSSSLEVMKDRMPAHIQALLERRVGDHGLSLRELALLASVLEHLVHLESMGWLVAAYRVIGAPLTGRASAAQVAEAMEIYMMMFVLGKDLPSMTPEEVLNERAVIERSYPTWRDTQLWLEDIRGSMVHVERSSANPFVSGAMTFEAAERVMEEVRDRHGRWQNAECTVLKEKLLARGDTSGTGRLSLAEFYGPDAANGEEYQFVESVSYLRQLGALDETDPRNPRVIVPNYVSGPNNCLAGSGLHAVCCIDECVGLLAEVERSIGEPMASSAKVARIVSQISSGTVDAPRNLTGALVSRLEEVAARHGGKVPLHGRLFAQWMHHAFPNECSFPHVSGSTAPRTPEQWIQETGQEVSITPEELQQHLKQRQAPAPVPEELLEWTEFEELVAAHHQSTKEEDSRSLWVAMPCLLLLVTFFFAALGSARSGLAALQGGVSKEGQKFYI